MHLMDYLIVLKEQLFFKAVSYGCRDFWGYGGCFLIPTNFATPCGACRQVIMEFGEESIIILANKHGNYQMIKAKELLPGAFTSKDLKN